MAAAAPPSLEALLALFSTGDLGKKLYSVLCRDIATVGKAQPFYRAKRLEAQHLPRGACWREIRGEVRRTEGTLVPAANRQAPRQARAVSLQRAPGPAPSGRLATWGWGGGAGAPRGAAVRSAPGPQPQRMEPRWAWPAGGPAGAGADLGWNTLAGSRAAGLGKPPLSERQGGAPGACEHQLGPCVRSPCTAWT